MSFISLRNQLLTASSRACRTHFARPFVHSFCYRNDQSLEKPPAIYTNSAGKGFDNSTQSKSAKKDISGFDNAKLQQIIETSNMSAARQVERQRQEQIEQELLEKKKTSGGDVIQGFEAKQAEIGAEMRESSMAIDRESSPQILKKNNPEFEKIKDDIQEPEPKVFGFEPSDVVTNTKHFDSKRFQQEISEKIHEKQVKLGLWAEAKWLHVQSSLKVVAKSLNDATGYSGIEKHKLLVEQVEQEIEQAREAVKTAKNKYEHAIQNRSDSQKEINELLTRKHTWTPVDVERFTELYKNDHTNQHEEATSKQELDEAEQNVENVQIKLTSSILTRYHEEQLWSDKIRQSSTWGTWMLMGVNIMLFATATFFVEPWKRRKLVNAFQEEVQQKLDEYSAELHGLSQRLSPEKRPILDVVGNDTEAYKISVFGIDSWPSFKAWVSSLVAAVQVPGNISFTFAKPDLAVFSGILVAMGWLLGSLVNFVVFRR